MKIIFIIIFFFAGQVSANDKQNSCDKPNNLCEFCNCMLAKPPLDQDRIGNITLCKEDCNVDLKK